MKFIQRTDLKTKTCPICKTDFVAVPANSVYCSPECRREKRRIYLMDYYRRAFKRNEEEKHGS
jgi:predicted nucleic acid-binding Zn ribbon protein